MKAVSADFETTTDPADCRVWAWGICDIYSIDDFYHGTDIQSFFKFIAASEIEKIWFHNLAFDGKFIIWQLLAAGYTHTDARRPGFMEFSTLISRQGKFYQITINLGGRIIHVYDSLKLFPMSVRKLAKTFDMPEQKGEIDYEAHREPGHELTTEELDYLRRDVQIVAHALALNAEQNLLKMTIGANAFQFFKESFGKKRFRKLFPVVPTEVDDFCRQAYRGGFTYCNPEYAGVDVGPGISVDYNSMYPSMMISKPYPVGEPVLFEGKYVQDDTHPLYVQRLTCMFEMHENSIPMVQLKGSWGFGEHEYVTHSYDPVTITLTSVDLRLFFEMYDVDVQSWDGGAKFAKLDNMFKSYVDHWGDVKRSSTGGKRQLAKLMLNNLYGKFATNPDVTPKYPVMDEAGVVHYVLGPDETRDPIYLPVGEFVTAYARETLIHAIMHNRERFLYCDTDSMHLLGTEPPEGIRTHDTDLCAWKVEGTFMHARHLRAKCYIWDLNGEVDVTCAGMPDNVKAMCTFENFHIGLQNYEVDENGCVTFVAAYASDGTPIDTAKLLPRNVVGGVVLERSIYKLRDK